MLPDIRNELRPWAKLTGAAQRDALVEEIARWIADHGEAALTAERLQHDLGIHQRVIRKHWPSYTHLRRELGLTSRKQTTPKYTDDELFEDLHALVEKLGAFPRTTQLERHAVASAQTYRFRFGDMAELREKYRRWLADREGTAFDPDPFAPTPADLHDAWQALRVAHVPRTSDYRDNRLHQTHTHDLVLCVDHDWPACPVKVVRLKDLVADPRTHLERARHEAKQRRNDSEQALPRKPEA